MKRRLVKIAGPVLAALLIAAPATALATDAAPGPVPAFMLDAGPDTVADPAPAPAPDGDAAEPESPASEPDADADGAEEVPDDAVGLLERAYRAVTSGDWSGLGGAVLLLIAMVATQRKFLGGVIDFFATDRGGVVLVFLNAFGGALGHSLLVEVSGGDMKLGAALLAALGVAIGAIGGYTGVKKFLWPKDAAGAGA